MKYCNYPDHHDKEKSKKKEHKKEHKEKKKHDPKKKHVNKDAKVEKVLHEFKEGELHSGSKKGPKVTNKRQALAIAINESKKAKKKKK